MLLIRGILFTLLVPVMLAVFVPQQLIGSTPMQSGLWQLGWLLIVLGALVYGWAFVSFLRANGTPAIFFTRHIRWVLGEEPSTLVQTRLYRFSRNPMYLSVVAVIVGQAILAAKVRVAWYGVALLFLFHIVVVFVEEPHLRARNKTAFDRYCRDVPRWFSLGASR